MTEEIASRPGTQVGQNAISPAAFPDLKTPSDFREIAKRFAQ
ncbi:MAG: hypothetical protein R2788_17265 [Saprospiraceae bacterium]